MDLFLVRWPPLDADSEALVYLADPIWETEQMGVAPERGWGASLTSSLLLGALFHSMMLIPLFFPSCLRTILKGDRIGSKTEIGHFFFLSDMNTPWQRGVIASHSTWTWFLCNTDCGLWSSWGRWHTWITMKKNAGECKESGGALKN